MTEPSSNSPIEKRVRARLENLLVANDQFMDWHGNLKQVEDYANIINRK
jgi:hypothetical protein